MYYCVRKCVMIYRTEIYNGYVSELYQKVDGLGSCCSGVQLAAGKHLPLPFAAALIMTKCSRTWSWHAQKLCYVVVEKLYYPAQEARRCVVWWQQRLSSLSYNLSAEYQESFRLRSSSSRLLRLWSGYLLYYYYYTF